VAAVASSSFSRPPSPGPTSRLATAGSSSVVSGWSHHHGGDPQPPPSIVDSCTTLVSATLVTSATRGCSYSDDSNGEGNGSGSGSGAGEGIHGRMLRSSVSGGGGDGDYLVLAHAEPIRRKRRIVACAVAWTVLTLAMVAVSVVLALLVNQHFVPATTTTTTTAPPPTLPMEGSHGPVTAPMISQHTTKANEDISNLAVSWGKISTCQDAQFFSDNDIVLQCGGGALELISIVNATCEYEQLENSSVNITNPSRVSCRMTIKPTTSSVTTPDHTQSVSYQELHALAIFSCSGLFKIDRTAIAALPEMTVHNCRSSVVAPTAPVGNQSNDRELSSPPPPPPPRRHSNLRVPPSRALWDGDAKEGASAFISMGSFCQAENSTDWTLYRESFPCETGSQLSTNSSIDAVTGEVTDAGNFCYALQPSPHGDDNKTHSTSCADASTGTCSYTLSAIEVSNLDVDCKSKPNVGPTRKFMVEEALKLLTPGVYIDRIIDLIKS
jgi:hypothetical protein